MAKRARQKDLAGFQERQCLHRAKNKGVWVIAITHFFNYKEQSWEEFQDNICLRYGMIPQYIPVTCNVCGKKFSI